MSKSISKYNIFLQIEVTRVTLHNISHILPCQNKPAVDWNRTYNLKPAKSTLNFQFLGERIKQMADRLQESI